MERNNRNSDYKKRAFVNHARFKCKRLRKNVRFYVINNLFGKSEVSDFFGHTAVDARPFRGKTEHMT